jgi:hypothetical protein
MYMYHPIHEAMTPISGNQFLGGSSFWKTGGTVAELINFDA